MAKRMFVIAALWTFVAGSSVYADDTANRNIAPIVSDIQPIANVAITMDGHTKTVTLRYSMENSTVVLLPVWTLGSRGIKLVYPEQDKEVDCIADKPILSTNESSPLKLKVFVEDLFAKGSWSDATQAKLKEEINKRRTKPVTEIVSPQIETMSYRATIRVQSDDRSVTATVQVPPFTIAQGEGQILLPVLPEQKESLKKLKPIDLYISITCLMFARFQQTQYLASLDIIDDQLQALDSILGSGDDKRAPVALVYLPATGGEVNQRQKVTNILKDFIVLNIEKRNDTDADLSGVESLTGEIIRSLITQVNLSQIKATDRLAVAMGNLATVNGTVDSIVKFSHDSKDERTNKITKLLDEYEHRKSDSNVKVDANFDSLFILGSASADVDVHNGRDDTTSRKNYLDTLSESLSAAGQSFEGSARRVNGIAFKQNFADAAIRTARARIQSTVFTEGQSRQIFPPIPLGGSSPPSDPASMNPIAELIRPRPGLNKAGTIRVALWFGCSMVNGGKISEEDKEKLSQLLQSIKDNQADIAKIIVYDHKRLNDTDFNFVKDSIELTGSKCAVTRDGRIALDTSTVDVVILFGFFRGEQTPDYLTLHSNENTSNSGLETAFSWACEAGKDCLVVVESGDKVQWLPGKKIIDCVKRSNRIAWKGNDRATDYSGFLNSVRTRSMGSGQIGKN